MVKRFFEVRKDENGDFYFTEARGQVVTVGGLSFGLKFNGRGLTATELTTGAAVATIDNPAEVGAKLSALIPIIKEALKAPAAKKIAAALKTHAAKHSRMWRYIDKKEEARAAAIAYQAAAAEQAQTYAEAEAARREFEKLARRFGLVREFRENAII